MVRGERGERGGRLDLVVIGGPKKDQF